MVEGHSQMGARNGADAERTAATSDIARLLPIMAVAVVPYLINGHRDAGAAGVRPPRTSEAPPQTVCIRDTAYPLSADEAMRRQVGSRVRA